MSQVPILNEPPGSPGQGPSTSLPNSPRPESPSPSASPNLDNSSQQQHKLRRPTSQSRFSKLITPVSGRSRSGSNASQRSQNQDDSGSISGRSTPELKRRAGRAASSALATDAKYKKFAQLVEKSLQSFESVNEWADFISFLSRLLKTLQAPSPPYPEIPRKLIVSKRLAQCLNPALPSGVHQRALDVYAYIFSVLGVEGLKRDLLIWSSGLFPFFQYAATSVRPHLINIYQTYYLPLGPDLRPATKALVLALLPGMEEETGDFFDQILSLLDRVSDAVTAPFFLQNIFLILISSPSSRLSALNYLSRRLLKPPVELITDSGLIIRGVSAALNDENVLVRRNGLDLLLRVLQLNGDLMKDATITDREIIMRSASDVLLQRELSLSRRVYTWLLGTSDTPAEQITYFKDFGLELLASTLQRDMECLSSSTDIAEAQRPFKIFLSLLDKWEVGSPLSERLALPALRAIKNATSATADVLPEEVIGTALAVYEAIEPVVTWKLLFTSVQAELEAKESGAIELVQWLLGSVPQHDEEVNSVHIPVMLDQVLSVIASDSLTVKSSLVAFRLATALLGLMSSGTFAKSATANKGATVEQRTVAENLYNSDGDPHNAQQRIHTQVLPRIVEQAFRICQTSLSRHLEEPESLLDAVKIVSTLIDHEVPALAAIDGQQWLAKIIGGLSTVNSFIVIEAIVTTALKASRCSIFKPSVSITSDVTMSAILDSLFRYLRPDAAPYHARAVELLWDYNQLAEVHTLENVIARRMNAIPFSNAAFDAFGIFWRLTDDSMLPGEIFNIPISIVIDALKNNDPDIQRQAETWMRCNLLSYFRVLDPIICRLLDPSLRYEGSTYAGPVDLSLIKHHIESISTLFKFGGQGLSKACHATDIHQSVHPTLIQRSLTAFPTAISYLDVLVSILNRYVRRHMNIADLGVRFVRTEAPARTKKVAPLVVRLQSAALELLQTIISRGDVSIAQLTELKASLVDKLHTAIHHRHLTLQSKMLHLLHSAISAKSATTKAQNHRRSPSLAEKSTAFESISDFEQNLVRMIIDGISTPTNLPVLQHWIDFVLMTVAQLAARPVLALSLSECFAQQLRQLLTQIQSVYDKTSTSVVDEKLSVTDAEVIMVLNALERVLVILGSGPGTRADDLVKQAEGEKGLLGLVSGVFTVEAPATETASRSEYPRYLDDAVHALLVTWTATASSSGSGSGPLSSRSQTFEKVRQRSKKVLEKSFRLQPLGVITSCVHVWATCSPDITDAAIFDCVDALTPSAQRVVELVCEAVSGKSNRNSIEFRPDPAYLAFLEAYVRRLEAPIALQVWSTVFGFSRDVIANANTSAARSQLLPVVQCLTAVALIVSKTSALEDRRLRRDLQDTYTKALDLVITNITRIAEAGMWTRAPIAGNDDAQPEKIDADQSLSKIYDFLTVSVIPNLRTLLIDADRVNSACSGMMTNIAIPAFRKQQVDPSILRIVIEITKIPSALKTWRIQIGDSFNDSRFFKGKSFEDIGYWKSLICSLMDSDKERFSDHLGRITSASSANIFSNREQEMLVKSSNLRRLSFILLAAERNHYLTHLPAIQERLVEMLRSSAVSPRVHSEVYLCLRVLMCRISPQHLINFWPVILAELLRIFESTMDDPPNDGSESLQLILAACKFLDLLLVLQSEDFQVHQWIFVTDTTDAVYPPEEYTPGAILDCLSAILSEGALFTTGTDAGEKAAFGSSDLSNPLAAEKGTKGQEVPRRPRLTDIKTLSSIHQLQPFLSRASIDTFESVYSSLGVGIGVDWEYVEDRLCKEVFEIE
ncbi:hypothetical protein I317_06612 [Kwoniella heveanensis CBS 569]|nr:hypothetical protein I317_06612 [Kwoniella heveanensis CBS 569]